MTAVRINDELLIALGVAAFGAALSLMAWIVKTLFTVTAALKGIQDAHEASEKRHEAFERRIERLEVRDIEERRAP